jgi:hypothetical protein
MIRFFEHLVQKEINTKQKHLRFYAWMLLITFIVCAFRVVTASIKVWNKYSLLQEVKSMAKKDKEEVEPIGI